LRGVLVDFNFLRFCGIFAVSNVLHIITKCISPFEVIYLCFESPLEVMLPFFVVGSFPLFVVVIVVKFVAWCVIYVDINEVNLIFPSLWFILCFQFTFLFNLFHRRHLVFQGILYIKASFLKGIHIIRHLLYGGILFSKTSLLRGIFIRIYFLFELKSTCLQCFLVTVFAFFLFIASFSVSVLVSFSFLFCFQFSYLVTKNILCWKINLNIWSVSTLRGYVLISKCVFQILFCQILMIEAAVFSNIK